jgi:hypothetical protein
MTIDEFRSHETLPAQWRKELEQNRILQIVLAVQDDNAPWHFVVPGDNQNDLSPTRAALELGTTRGYAQYGDRLKLLAQRKQKREDPGESTYQKPLNPNEPPQQPQ